eukprot:CAMPEP_0174857276 /NCGR_PEP_ID=MMETSP1114-20130205/38256_1 /TAXON_ID=312471 /ORGANISM="Neobodo designis, Strain CCAP 1951/1" /LENGTH=43 /DNA_ID= /DNA_START= /DNA_END= /DNA_ORIENTATION=
MRTSKHWPLRGSNAAASPSFVKFRYSSAHQVLPKAREAAAGSH